MLMMPTFRYIGLFLKKGICKELHKNYNLLLVEIKNSNSVDAFRKAVLKRMQEEISAPALFITTNESHLANE